MTTPRRRQSRFLFDWNAFDGLDHQGRLVARTGQIGTFDRGGTAGAATTVDVNGRVYAPGYKTPRFYHQYNATTGLWENQGVLLEGQRADSALGSCALGDGTYWGRFASYTVSAATSCIQGQTAYKHLYAAGVAFRDQNIGTFVSGQSDCLWMIVENVNDSVSDLAINDVTAATLLVRASFNWSTKAISVIAGAGSCGAVNLGGGRYLIYVVGAGTGAGTGAAGNTRQALIFPSGSGTVGQGSIVHHVGFEANAKFPSQPIVTVASAITRSPDSLLFSVNFPPQLLTVYCKHTELGTALDATTSKGLWALGDATNAALFVYGNGTHYEAIHRRAADVSSTAAAAPSRGDTVETNTVLYGDGSVQLSQSLNVGAVVAAAASAANALATSFSAATLRINGRTAGTTNGWGSFQQIRIAGGVQTMAYMRAP